MSITEHEHPARVVARALALLLTLAAALIAFAPAASATGPGGGTGTNGATGTNTAPGTTTAGDPAQTPASEPWVEPADPLGPDELTTSLGRIGLATPGQQLTLEAVGFRPGDTVQAILDPVTATATPLGTATTDSSGALSLQVALPATLGVGDHTILATGTDPSGASTTRTLAVLTPPTALTSSGTDSQSVVLPIPARGWVTLLDNNDEPVTQVSSRDQGIYSLDPATGRVTFAANTRFWGPVRPAHFRLTDGAGQQATGTYAPMVEARPLPSVRAADRTLTDASGATAQVGCTAGPIAVVKCEVTLTAVVGSEYVVLGSGIGETATPVVGTRVADVTLTEHGRRLAGRPGGIAADITVRMWVPDRLDAVEATGTTVLTALTVTAPRTIRYPAGGLDVPDADLPYLNALRSRMTDVTAVTCTGGTDDQGDADANRRIAEDRARRVCDYLTANTRARAVVRSVGADQPVADNATEDGRARNRRVEIVFSYAPEASA